MPRTSYSLLSYLRLVAGAWRDDPRDDATLLARFVESRDEAAFATLVSRHGPLVWQTCRRTLGDTPDAEDAFQTTFLALARKAGRFPVESLAGWLHQVARQTALNADAGSRRRRDLKQWLRAVKEVEGKGRDADRTEVYAALDEELAGLSEPLRIPLLLHYLEGKSQVEVARLLGCSRWVVQYRLTRAEAALRKRLARRGLAMGSLSVGTLLGSTATAQAIPAGLIGSTTRAALRSLSFPLGPSMSVTLAEGVMKTILGTKMKLVTALLGLTLCLAGGGLLAYQALTGNAEEPLQTAGEPRGEAEASRQPGAVTRVDCYGDPLPTHALARMGTTRLWYGREEGWPLSRAVAFSPDGKTLATHISGMTVCLWDAATGKEIRRLTTKTVKGWIASLGFSPDSKTLVAVNGESRTVCLWEVATGKFLRKQEYQGAKKDNVRFFQVAFVPDGKMLGYGTVLEEDRTTERGAYVWDVATGKEICQLSRPLKEGERGGRNTAFSLDGKLLATVATGQKDDLVKKGIFWSSSISLWDVATGKEIRQLICEGAQESGGVCAVAFSPDVRTLASVELGKICVWELATGKKIHLLKAAVGSSPNLLTYSPDGKTLLGGSDRESHLWDVGTGREIRSFGWDRAVAALFSSDGKTLAVEDEEGAIRLWEVATGKEIGPRKGYRGPIASIAYSPDGKTLASMGERTIRLWEAATGKEMRPLAKHTTWHDGSIAYSPDGKILASADDIIHLWDTATGKEIRQFDGRGGFVFTWWATFSPDGKKLAASWRHNSLVSVWEVASGKQIYTLATHQQEIGGKQVAIAFSPDGRLLATPGKDNTVCLWKVATGKLIGQLGRPKKRSPEGHSLFVFSLAFSPDGRLLATSSSGEVEGKVRLWEVASGKEICQLRALKPRFHKGCVLAFSTDGRMLATAAVQNRDGKSYDPDPTIRLWEVASGQEIGRLAGHQSFVRTVAFSPDGKTLASGSDDLTCLIWDVTFAGRLKPVPARSVALLSKEQLEAAWTGLADRDPVKAYRALGTLTLSPTQAIALLQARLRPVAPLTNPQQLKRWIADLDDSSFTMREKAQREIEKLGEGAIPALRQALKGRPTLEAKRRLQNLLAEWEPQLIVDPPQLLRVLRAVLVLEFISTTEARQLLQAWAKGVPEAHLTQEAEAALAHWAKRSAARP